MKKSLLALAVLGAFAGVASAQSSVTLDGTVDVNGRYVKNDGQNRRITEATDGINSSQLRFSGREDLGGGLWAGFNLNSGISADTGQSSGDKSSKFWNRRATVSLGGNFGEIRLGRDYTPTFSSTSAFDPFGTNGLGDSSGAKQMAASDYVRADNTIGYFLPANIGGVYGQLMAGAGESTAAGRYIGGRVGFAAGPFDVAVAYSQERIITGGASVLGAPIVAANDQYKTFNIGGAYDFGVVKLMGYFNQEKIFDFKDNMFLLGAVVPLGQGEIHVSGEMSKLNSPVAAQDGNKVKKYQLGYVYNLSKRTALYATGSIIDNDNASTLSLSGGFGAATAGGKSKGAEFGIRHFF